MASSDWLRPSEQDPCFQGRPSARPPPGGAPGLSPRTHPCWSDGQSPRYNSTRRISTLPKFSPDEGATPVLFQVCLVETGTGTLTNQRPARGCSEVVGGGRRGYLLRAPRLHCLCPLSLNSQLSDSTQHSGVGREEVKHCLLRKKLQGSLPAVLVPSLTSLQPWQLTPAPVPRLLICKQAP